MPDEDILAQFQEFLTAKAEKEKADADSEDFDVEIWDKDGRGVRTKRSHARPFLQSLGIDLDPEPTDPPKDGDKSKSKTPPKPVEPGSPVSTARKYFTKQPGK